MLLQFPMLRIINNDHRLIKGASQNSIKKELQTTTAALAMLCALHTGAMMKFEDLSFGDSLWLTFTTVATVGYGDLSAKTPEGRASTGGLLYLGGISLLAQSASLAFAYRQIKKENIQNGKREWKMHDHIVILNAPEENAVDFFRKMITELRKSNKEIAKRPIIIVSPDLKDGLPDDLRKMGVAHVNEEITSDAAFANSDIGNAGVIVILSKDEESDYSDSISIHLVMRARKANSKARIIAEAVSDRNIEELKHYGAGSVVSPDRASCFYIPKAIAEQGIEAIAKDFTSMGGADGINYEVKLNAEWRKVVEVVNANDIGTAVGYIDQNNNPISFPHPDSTIDATALLVVVREDQKKTPQAVAQILSRGLING